MLCLEDSFDKNDAAVFEQMFKTGKIDFSYYSNNHSSVVHFAALKGDLKIVKQLIELGADVNEKNYNESSVLHFAALSGNVKLVQWLVEHSADAFSIARNGESALFYAVQSDNLELIQWLYEQGVPLFKNTSNDFIQICAARNANLKLVQWLQDRGVSVKTNNEENQTVLPPAADAPNYACLIPWLIKYDDKK